MLQKKLFQKRNRIRQVKFYIIYLIFILIFCFFYYYFFLKDKNYFIIPSYKESFFLIPDNKGGQKISNLNKKGLHLSYDNSNKTEIINDKTLKYSIQLITSYNYSFIKQKREELIKKKDTIFLPYELFIVIFENDLENEYFLLYKNFPSRLKAFEYCNKYAYFLENCLIVNVQNL